MAILSFLSIFKFNGLVRGLSYPITKSFDCITIDHGAFEYLKLKCGFTLDLFSSIFTILLSFFSLAFACAAVAVLTLFFLIYSSSFFISSCCLLYSSKRSFANSTLLLLSPHLPLSWLTISCIVKHEHVGHDKLHLPQAMHL